MSDKGKRGRPKFDAAVALLHELLNDGDERPEIDVRAEAKMRGICPRTLADARRHVKIISRLDGFRGSWLLSWPPVEDEDDQREGAESVLRACDFLHGASAIECLARRDALRGSSPPLSPEAERVLAGDRGR